MSTWLPGRAPRRSIVILLIFQLGGCAADILTWQVVPNSIVCTGSSDVALQIAFGVLWIPICFSWIVGLLALVFAKLQPVYFALLILALPLYAWQLQSLNRHALFCDVF